MATKIATCCYCGTRAALVLTESGRHELSCVACGAPLHEMKAMPVRKAESAAKPAPKAASARPAPRSSHRKSAPRRGKKPKHVRKFSPMRMFSKALEEVWDEIEDIFD